jgi:GNAT superfamily N-acetyltransferase
METTRRANPDTAVRIRRFADSDFDYLVRRWHEANLASYPYCAEHQRRGIGSALLSKARERSPQELRLYTFQRNGPARAFYERHGFMRIAFGVSPAPEYEPDVEYRWRA